MIRIEKRLLFLFAVILTVLIFSVVFLNPVRYIFVKIIQLPIKIIHSFLSQIRSLMTLRVISFDMSKYIQLKNDYAILKSEFDELYTENKRLRKLLEFKTKSRPQYVVAKVIFTDASNWSWGLVINKGSSSGLKKDDPVVTAQGLVGKVADVWRDTSHVMLLNDSDFAASALLKSTREKGVVVGSLDGSCRMIYVSDISDISRGEEVITAGEGSIFPAGIPIGRVVVAENDYLGASYFVVRPYVKINQLEEVLVIKK